MKNNNIVEFNREIEGLAEDCNTAIVIEHGPLTLQAVQELSDFVYDLPIERDAYDKLVKLLKNQLLAAEREQYIKGFVDGVEACKAGTMDVLADRLLVSDNEMILKDK